jgi:hypothetical protein
VAYQLALPSKLKLGHVFHVSCLKKVIGTKVQTQTSLPELDEEGPIKFQTKTSLPKLDEEGSTWLQPQAVLAE